MSEAVVIDISSLIRRESQRGSQHQQSQRLTERYQLPEYYYPSYLRHPNQPFSSPSSISSSSSLSSYHHEEEGEESIVNESSSAISVDGEFDVRIDMIRPSPEKKIKVIIPTSASAPAPASPQLSPNLIAGAGVCQRASAPPLSDDEIDEIDEIEYIEHEREHSQQIQQIQQIQQQEEACVCVICYENFEEPVQLIRGRNYSSEELEEIEGKEKITNFCQTCKYNVHHKCIDEYRLAKMTDMIRSGYQHGYIQPPNVAGTFGMKCLICSKEVEKIHVSVDGEIDIVKTHTGGVSSQNQQQQQGQQQGQQQEQQIEEIMRNRMQRRLRRRQRIQFCKNKICTICFMLLLSVTLLVLLFRSI